MSSYIVSTNYHYIFLANYYLKTNFEIRLYQKNDDLILKYINSDKKNYNGIYNFTLIKNIGDPIVNCPVSDRDILSSLDFLIQ